MFTISSGGHFGAMEEPELMAEDILSFAGIVVTTTSRIIITSAGDNAESAHSAIYTIFGS